LNLYESLIVYSTDTFQNTIVKQDRGRRGRDRVVVGFTTNYMQSVPITTNVVSSKPDQGEVNNIM